jgi:hypothetical protein
MNEAIPLQALRAILQRGGIPETDDMAVRLWQGVGGSEDRRGLRSLEHEYRMLRIAKAAPTPKATAGTLEKLIELAREGAEILDRDLTGVCELNVALGAFGADNHRGLAFIGRCCRTSQNDDSCSSPEEKERKRRHLVVT